MRHFLLAAALWLLACLAAVVGAEAYDRDRARQAALNELQGQLDAHGARLQARLDGIARHNRALAQALAHDAGMSPTALEALAAQAVAEEPLLASVLVSRHAKAVFVYPQQGNEAIVGLNYDLRPEFMASFKRASETRATAFDVPVRLIQTRKDGIIARTAVFVHLPSSGEDVLWGHVSMGVDLERLLRSAGFLAPQAGFALAIRSALPQQHARPVFGDPAVFQGPHAQTRLALSDSTWDIGAAPLHPAAYPPGRAWALRAAGLCLALAPLLALLAWRLRGAAHQSATAPGPRRYGLRAVLLLAVLVPVPVMVGLSALLSFEASTQAADELEQRHATEMALRIHDRVTAFFDIPRQMVIYNAEQFRAGLLRTDQPQAALHNFLLQMRRQPLLTFLSLGTTEGDYYTASRPPRGGDKALNVMRSSSATGHALHIQRVDDDYRSSPLAFTGNRHFDVRDRPWFRAAVTANAICWYPAYRYTIQDAEGVYDAMGIGMSVPLYDQGRRFVGVLAADVALSQLSELLRELTASIGGVAFLTEGDGALLASSGSEPVYHLDGETARRIQADASENPAIRSAQATVRASQATEGRQRITVQGERYLTNWQTIQLPDGPALTIVVGLPERHFTGPARDTLHTTGYLTLAFGLFGVLLAMWVAQRLAQPLLSIHQWAQRLAQGHWQSPPPLPSAVREVADLSLALGDMAEHLQRNTQELEQRVHERTAALAEANRQLEALAVTDGLTGIANRRHFDSTLALEWARAQRSQQPLALLMLDVDLFKDYNDHYGHQAGDETLRAIAQVLLETTRRAGDLAARYGGEEFAVIAANTGAAAARQLAESLRAAVQHLAIAHALARQGHVTVSIGLALLEPGRPVPAQTLIGQADEALYRAKTLGRNRVEQAWPDPLLKK